ncbi:calreticulin family protein [Cystoisospora suis]|uniref:Calreticulin family protein n=1 Tax=Cystoisospora suis TaxID=483139 RepID=A0A2C6KMH6_9APIC|nr:calreticulin family protein [Cystoisospora suis]
MRIYRCFPTAPDEKMRVPPSASKSRLCGPSCTHLLSSAFRLVVACLLASLLSSSGSPSSFQSSGEQPESPADSAWPLRQPFSTRWFTKAGVFPLFPAALLFSESFPTSSPTVPLNAAQALFRRVFSMGVPPVMAEELEDDILPEEGIRDEEDGIIVDDSAFEEGEDDVLLMQPAATASGTTNERGGKTRRNTKTPPPGPGDEGSSPAQTPETEKKGHQAALFDRHAAASDLQNRLRQAIKKFPKGSSAGPGDLPGLLYLEMFQGRPLESGRWVPSADPKFQGRWNVEAREENVLEGDQGLLMVDSLKHHGICTRLPKPIADTRGKDFVFQYEVSQTRPLSCGGSYLKLLNLPGEKDLSSFNHLTDYIIMFGPDQCQEANKIHFIFKLQNPVTGEWTEHQLVSPPKLPLSPLTTLLTLWIKSDDTFEIQVNHAPVRSGSLLTDMHPPLQPPETLQATTGISVGEQPSRRVTTKGVKNPSYFKVEEPHRLRGINAIGMELWTVEGGTAFDNLLIADNIQAAKLFAKTTFDVRAELEEVMHKELNAVREKWHAEYLEKHRQEEEETGEEKKRMESMSIVGLLGIWLRYFLSICISSPFSCSAAVAAIASLLLILLRGRQARGAPWSSMAKKDGATEATKNPEASQGQVSFTKKEKRNDTNQATKGGLTCGRDSGETRHRGERKQTDK